jgi:hypothetical protein
MRDWKTYDWFRYGVTILGRLNHYRTREDDQLLKDLYAADPTLENKPYTATETTSVVAIPKGSR